MPKLGVNIDHVATLRQARGEEQPNLLVAAAICEKAGAHSIVAHLREDRRHIQDTDVRALKKTVKRLNLEMSIAADVVQLALDVRPHVATLVPERRQELTTEGGLNVVGHFSRIKRAVERLQNKNIIASLFVDPRPVQIEAAKKTGAWMIELHTGDYARALSPQTVKRELMTLQRMTRLAREKGLIVSAGHGLNYANTRAVADIEGIEELNIGHSIVTQAVFAGLKQAVKEMVKLVK